MFSVYQLCTNVRCRCADAPRGSLRARTLVHPSVTHKQRAPWHLAVAWCVSSVSDLDAHAPVWNLQHTAAPSYNIQVLGPSAANSYHPLHCKLLPSGGDTIHVVIPACRVSSLFVSRRNKSRNKPRSGQGLPVTTTTKYQGGRFHRLYQHRRPPTSSPP